MINLVLNMKLILRELRIEFKPINIKNPIVY